MKRHRIVVVGASFAGLAAALELERLVGERHEVVLLSKGKDFVFLPSLIWVPFGLREKREISFPVAKVLERRRIRHVAGAARAIDLDAHVVHGFHEDVPYDTLVVATGVKQDFAAISGLGPESEVQSIFTWDDADRARFAFEEFVDAPGPVVIGSVQGASSFAPAYELAFNMAHELEKRGLRAKCPITFVTPEPFVGHLGTGTFGRGAEAIRKLVAKNRIEVITNAAVERVQDRTIVLAGGRALPFAYAMLTPPFVGVDAVRRCGSIVDERGLVVVGKGMQTVQRDVFAAGACVSVPLVEGAAVPMRKPINGRLSEEMGRVAARNAVASIEGGAFESLDLDHLEYTVDAGTRGASVDTRGDTRSDEGALPVPMFAGHWAKVAYERFFLSRRSRGI